MEILRYSAFAATAGGGNPAGVVLDAHGVTEAEMLATAVEIGYSETAFLTRNSQNEVNIRYFSPQIEVPFCGHATIATAVAYAEQHGTGTLHLRAQSGLIRVTTDANAEGQLIATLVSVQPQTKPISDTAAAELLTALRWSPDDLDPAIALHTSYAGVWHPIVAVNSRERLANLDYDYEQLLSLMHRESWTTINLIWRESEAVYHSRNPFPTGGVYEDPATGAAAAALGGYLRELDIVPDSRTFTVLQGYDMGKPSIITVTVPVDRTTGISVSGTAKRL